MTFRTLHTTSGLQLMADAEITGSQIRLTHMAVGDGAGNFVTPSESQTTLVRERYRNTINRRWQDPDVATMYSAELVIPASEGGFTIREVGIFDSNGTLFAVGNLPMVEKPTDGQGAFSDVTVRISFMVLNASTVTIVIDPNVQVVTQSWVLNNVNPAMLLPGGTTGQVLRKHSNTDGDVEWHDPTDVNITVNSIEETQTLAAGQKQIDWAVVNNTGLAVYKNGQRLRADEYTKDTTIHTRITLAAAGAAGDKIIGVQNEPAGTLPDPLVKGQNLADVPNKATARQNLDVFSRSETRQMAPAGEVAMFARSTAPTGWLKCNGAAVSRTAYADLFGAIGTMFGVGDGSTSFNLPDLRGEFLRAWDDGRGVDSGRALGSQQGDQVGRHTHGGGKLGAWDQNNSHTGSDGFEEGKGRPDWRAADIDYAGGNETRPRNRALLACIKY